MKFDLESETLEFKKSTSELKEACISIGAILNKHGVGTLYFGIKPDGTVIGQNVSESTLRDVSRAIYESIHPQIYPVINKVALEDKAVIKVEFNGSEAPYSVFGKYYLRTADEDRTVTPHALQTIFADKAYRESWETADSGLSADDVDRNALKRFFETSQSVGRMPYGRFQAKGLLTKLGLLKDNHLNHAGEVLFGNDQPLTLKMALFATPEKITFLDQRQESDHLMNLILLAENYILKNLNWKSEIEGLERVETPEIPVPVVREVIANCFAHARYQTNMQHEICVYPDRITIFNPGSFANPFTPEDYVRKNLPSVTRNALIAKCMYLCKKIEAFGSGIKRIDSLCKDAGIEYTYDNTDVGFTFILKRKQDRNVTLNVSPDVTLTTSEQAILVLLKENPELTREELAERISKTVRTVQRALNALREKGCVRRIGSKRAGRWEVVRQAPSASRGSR